MELNKFGSTKVKERQRETEEKGRNLAKGMGFPPPHLCIIAKYRPDPKSAEDSGRLSIDFSEHWISPQKQNLRKSRKYFLGSCLSNHCHGHQRGRTAKNPKL